TNFPFLIIGSSGLAKIGPAFFPQNGGFDLFLSKINAAMGTSVDIERNMQPAVIAQRLFEVKGARSLGDHDVFVVCDGCLPAGTARSCEPGQISTVRRREGVRPRQ